MCLLDLDEIHRGIAGLAVAVVDLVPAGAGILQNGHGIAVGDTGDLLIVGAGAGADIQTVACAADGTLGLTADGRAGGSGGRSRLPGVPVPLPGGLFQKDYSSFTENERR